MATALLLRRSLKSLNNTIKSSIQRYHSVLAGKLGKTTFPQRFSDREAPAEITNHTEMAIWNTKMMVRYKSEFVRRIEDEDEVLNSKTANSGKRVSRRGKSEMNNNSTHCQGSVCDDSSDDDYSDCNGYSSDFDSHKDGEYPKDGAFNYDPDALGGSSSDVHGASHGAFNPSDGSSDHIDIVGTRLSDGDSNHTDIVGSHSSDGGSNHIDIVGSGSSDGGSSCGGGCGGDD